jgi:hypothetical protein
VLDQTNRLSGFYNDYIPFSLGHVETNVGIQRPLVLSVFEQFFPSLELMVGKVPVLVMIKDALFRG